MPGVHGVDAGSVIVTTDSPLLFFWMLTAYLAWHAIKTRRAPYWYVTGISLGLGMLSKFLIFPLVAAIFLFLLLSPEDRFWLRRKEPYLALILAILVFSPFLYWNSRHGWATFAFNTTRHAVEYSLTRPLSFLGGQAALLSPVLFTGLLWSLYRLLRRAVRGETKGGAEGRVSLYLLLCGWVLPVLFFFQSFRGSVGAHWPMAAYGTAFVGLALELGRRRRQGRLPGAWLWGGGALWTVLVVTLTIFPGILPRGSLAGHEVSEAYGWEELGRKVAALHEKTGKENIIATSGYTFSSMVSFYTPNHLYLSVLGPGSNTAANTTPGMTGRDGPGGMSFF